MNNFIITNYKKIRKTLIEKGKKSDNYQELIGHQFQMNYEKKIFDEKKEINEIRSYMGLKKYNERYQTEKHHYLMFKEILLHKLIEIEYYFKEKIDQTRKCVAFSTDCISMINILQRQNTLYAFIHLRSSHCDNLLPLDLLHINIILNQIAKKYPSIKILSINFTIASLHLY